jgi:hypothetical protein
LRAAPRLLVNFSRGCAQFLSAKISETQLWGRFVQAYDVLWDTNLFRALPEAKTAA